MDEPLKLSIITRTIGRIIAALLAALLLCSITIVALLYDPPAATWPVTGGAQSAPSLTAQTLVANQAITTALTAVTEPFNVLDHDTISLWMNYTAGDEDGVIVTVRWLYSNASGALEFQEADWSATAGERTLTANSYSMTVSANSFATFDVTGVPYARVYIQGTGTITTAGAISITYSATAP